MSGIQILHRVLLEKESNQNLNFAPNLTHFNFSVWKTCLREIYFADEQAQLASHSFWRGHPQIELYQGVDAEAFLAEVLSGLKSQMIGETEVFGQFKNWWNQLPATHSFKQRYQNRIGHLFNLVKQVREKALSGQGSQSYGSLIRKNLKPQQKVEVIGSGHLVEEILPWLQKQSSVRLWCRDVNRAQSKFAKNMAQLNMVRLNMMQLCSMSSDGALADVVIVAAPMGHEDLNQWLFPRGFSKGHVLFDLRADSSAFEPFVKPAAHKTLQDFFSDFATGKDEIQKKADQARGMILAWKASQQSESQVRPYGWDDL